MLDNFFYKSHVLTLQTPRGHPCRIDTFLVSDSIATPIMNVEPNGLEVFKQYSFVLVICKRVYFIFRYIFILGDSKHLKYQTKKYNERSQ